MRTSPLLGNSTPNLAALRRAGFRPANRYIVFQTLPHTLGLGPEVWRVLAKAHQKRNDAEYEGFVDVEERLVKDVIGAAHTVERALDALPPSGGTGPPAPTLRFPAATTHRRSRHPPLSALTSLCPIE